MILELTYTKAQIIAYGNTIMAQVFKMISGTHRSPWMTCMAADARAESPAGGVTP